MLDRRRVDQAVAFIARKRTLRGPELARVVGEYLLDAFFDGDFEEFRRQSRSKPVSFRALAARHDLGFSGGRLCTLVRISRQLRELPRSIGDGLSLSHHRALLPLHDVGLKRQLAGAACRGAWSRERLEQEVRLHLSSGRVGRKPLTVLIKAATQLRRSVLEMRDIATVAELSRLNSADLDCLRDTLQQSRAALVEVAAILQALDAAPVADGECFPRDIGSAVSRPNPDGTP